MRRQHSCDQCRRSKRACDAAPLEGGSDEQFLKAKPCSYCLRTKKTCTMEWAKSQLQTSSSASSGDAGTKRQRADVEGASWSAVDSIEEFDPASLLQDVTQVPGLVFPNVTIPSLDFALPNASLDTYGVDDAVQDAVQGLATPFSGSNPSDSSGLLDMDFTPGFLTANQPRNPARTRVPISKRRRRSSARSNQSSLSAFSMDQTMMARSNNQLISTNLLQIYHDVFEHNLSCWVTEVTCPYKTQRSVAITTVRSEWGPSWSNRIYRRTIKLDRVAQSANMIQLARSEDKAALRALHLAIMAFATQWAQGSRRQRQRFADGRDDLAEELAAEMTDEFDRNLQRHFWDQAQRALQEVSDLESYRVVCAELIFGLTQKPWMDDDHPSAVDPAMFSSRRGNGDVKTSAMAQIKGIIAKEGPPTYMERATRKMHALKYRYDSKRRGLEPGSETGINDEDKGTIGLLYWLAVMFDTVSSSMNERPVVVSDEDCQHSTPGDFPEPDESLSGRWKIDVFIQDLEQPGDTLHWPCSYEIAAEAVTKSAPIKVLLFRHLSYLQNILRKGGRGQKIEEIIKSTTSVYRYWNMTYGSFFRELVQHFDKVPSRIQGWFVCISAHWHLAALMLADLVDFVDEHGLGVEAEAQSRANSKMACRIRESSVRELADLASVATPPEPSTYLPQMPDFHHAVNEGTILTEPWTMILIRAFSKASVILLGEADEELRYGRGTLGHCCEESADSLERAEECVRALWLLGKKSDMARKTAEVLSVAADGLRN